MAEELVSMGIPIPERLLRDLSQNPSALILGLEEQDPTHSVKLLHSIIGPVLGTADAVDLSPSHRVTACNAVCNIIEKCQASHAEHIHNAILDDSIWIRIFEIYLQRSENVKGKSMRQILITLTNVLLKNQTPRSLQLRKQALSILIEIICKQQDRVQVKPALQGLAHFLQKDLVSIVDLIELYQENLDSTVGLKAVPELIQDIFVSFLSWVVHHDTALSAGHLIKNFLGSLRRSPQKDEGTGTSDLVSPLWIVPVVQTLHIWQDRIQEFKTYVFPHCFLPKVEEYTRFLSYLHFGQHIHTREPLPEGLRIYDNVKNGLGKIEEFRILLAAIQTGKELGILKDVDHQQRNDVEVHGNVVCLRDSIFGAWLSDPEPEVRISGLFLSVYSAATTRPISGGVFDSLRRNLSHLHTDTDANLRKDVLNHIQRLFDRLRGSTANLAKTKTGKSNTSQTRIPFPEYSAGSLRQTRSRSSGDALTESLEFILWYLRFLESELRSSSSYQRRITALRALSIILRSGLDPNVPHRHLSKSAQSGLRWAHGLQISNTRLLKSLMDMVIDPFDDTRNASTLLLEVCMDSIPKEEKATTLLILPKFIKRAEAIMLRTGRADQADGVARAYSLLFSQCNEDLPISLEKENSGLWTKTKIVGHLTQQLEETIELLRTDMASAVEGRPIHGTFAALMYIMDQDTFYADLALLPKSELQTWKEVHIRIGACFEKLWDCIQDVLCVDAPEGHVPEEFEEEASLDTKELLSYCWRGLKEASTLIRTLVSKAPIGTDETSILGPEDIERLGKLCFFQLVELRHRGAHSTVAQTFATFCRRCRSSTDDGVRALPEVWYQETLLCIQDKATAITRRSAGIPSLMTGIIAAEQQTGGTLFPRAMRDLFAEASQDARSTNIEESRLPQVHALNSIKEIFTNSKLSVTSEAYIGDGLDLAARTLMSSIWPIRNCGLMLFKALIERLLGSDESQDWKDQERTKSLRFSYSKYPQLTGILANLLDPNGPLRKSMTSTTDTSPMDLHGAEGVFPALQILRQAPPPDGNRDTITKSVQNLLASPHWHLRDMAARTLLSLHRPHEYLDAIKMLLACLEAPHNTQHGVLLSLKYMLKKYLATSDCSADAFSTILAQLQAKAPTFCGKESCPATKAAFIDLVNICDLSTLQQSSRLDPPFYASSWLLAHSSLKTDHIGVRIQGDALLQRSLNTAIVIDTITRKPSEEPKDVYTLRQTLGGLASTDPDTCCEVLQSLDAMIRTTPSTSLAVSKAHILSDVHNLILHENDDEVLAIAQSIVVESLSEDKVRQEFFAIISKTDVLKTIEILKLQCLDGPPSNMQTALHLLGEFLDFAFRACVGLELQQAVVRHIVHYIRILRTALVDTNPFDTRYAAVQSISRLDSIWSPAHSSTAPSSLILGLALVLYDMLHDDDYEIRDAAATATSQLLRGQAFQRATNAAAVPIITVQRLGAFLATFYAASPHLRNEAERRLTDGCLSQNALCTRTFAGTLASARKQDTALFSQEKQNLYRDDVHDVVFWAAVLRSMPPPRAVPESAAAALTAWVLAGLAALTDTARNEVDGPIGWTHKAEVFTLGFRVLCAADVVLRWEGEGASRVRRALRELADVGVERELNGLWLDKVECVLEDSVRRIVQGVYRTLSVL